jgi:hypothetical protein
LPRALKSSLSANSSSNSAAALAPKALAQAASFRLKRPAAPVLEWIAA